MSVEGYSESGTVFFPGKTNINKLPSSGCSQSSGDDSHANRPFSGVLYICGQYYTLLYTCKAGETQKFQQWHQLGSLGEGLTFWLVHNGWIGNDQVSRCGASILVGVTVRRHDRAWNMLGTVCVTSGEQRCTGDAQEWDEVQARCSRRCVTPCSEV